ncbi:MAG: SpoIIE family protein phosphatase [Spirochaetes bacterium]|nr:SpoIIE family protein phosphatase [Spirochaetota bacterium]
MNSPELKKILATVKIFDGMTDSHLGQIVPLLRPVNCQAGTKIINEGDPGISMYIIKQGSVKVTRTQDDDDEIFIGNLAAGSYFGELSLIDNLPRSANVIALEDSSVFQLGKSDFDDLLKKNADIAVIFYRNCLTETFARFRNNLASITFSEHTLREKSAVLDVISRDLSVAQEIQSVFINSEAMQQEEALNERVRHDYLYHPCIEVGGDFMDIVRLKDGLLAVIIADVEGHGVTAALATGILKSAFSILTAECGDRPSELMTRLNEHFSEVLSRKLFATSYYALIDAKAQKIITAKAGHHHPLFWKEEARDFLPMEGSGPGLGIIPDAVYTQREYAFGRGDRLIFFTDGIIEQFNFDHEMYSHKRLKELVRGLVQAGEKDILSKIYDDVIRYADGAPVEDDITLLMLEFT